MEKRYRALRIIAVVLKIIGYISLVLTLIASVGICIVSAVGGATFAQFSSEMYDYGMGSPTGAEGILVGVVAGIAILLYGLLGSLLLIAGGESIYLQLAVEENTRMTARLLADHLRASAQPVVQTPPPPAV